MYSVLSANALYKLRKIVHSLLQKLLIFSGCQHRQHMCRRWIIHQHTVCHLFLIKSFVILLCSRLNAIVIRMIALYDRLTCFSPSARTADGLCQQLKCTFCTAIVSSIQRQICRNRTDQRHIRKIMSFNDHLRTYQNICFVFCKR